LGRAGEILPFPKQCDLTVLPGIRDPPEYFAALYVGNNYLVEKVIIPSQECPCFYEHDSFILLSSAYFGE